jgi:hypothetical protein
MPVVKPRSNGFKGNTYLLVNAANSSATFYFAEIAKENNMATLVGETTGGSQQGLNGGMMFFLRLPNSTIEIDIPIIGSFSAEKPQGGIQPDIIVAQTVQDLIKGEDKVIEETRSLIKRISGRLTRPETVHHHADLVEQFPHTQRRPEDKQAQQHLHVSPDPEAANRLYDVANIRQKQERQQDDKQPVERVVAPEYIDHANRQGDDAKDYRQAIRNFR